LLSRELFTQQASFEYAFYIYKASRLKSLLLEVFYPKSFTDENVVNGVGL